MKRLAIAATILTVASGCDKANSALARAGDDGRSHAGSTAQTAPAPRPDVLFQVFGDRTAPRMIPLATLAAGRLARIERSAAGWREFDEIYTRAGAVYPVYHDGVNTGTLHVRRGMWERADSAVYSLPNCRALTPLAEVQLDGDAGTRTVELLASTRPLGSPRAARTTSDAGVSAHVRTLGRSSAAARGIARDALDHLAFRALSVPTGASGPAGAPTLVGSYVDDSPHDAHDRRNPPRVSHLLFLADSATGAASYSASYTRGGSARADSLEFQRYVDHLDIDGDGVDEIVLDAWSADASSVPVVLGFRDGRWRELFRGSPTWCADARR